MKKSTLFILVILVSVTGLIGFRLVSNKEKIDQQNAPAAKVDYAIPVTVDTATLAGVSQQLVKTGDLIPYSEADITATTAGKVEQVRFGLGSHITRGATLITIDSRLKQMALEAAQLTIDKLKKDVTRYNTLLAGNATTELQVNEVKYNYENALNQAAQLKKQLADASVKAPMSGQVVKKEIEAGEYISPGQVLGKVLDVSRLKVNVPINESDVYSLKKGQAVKVTTEIFPGRAFSGHITYISPQGSEQHSYPVEITLDQAGPLKAGTFVSVDFTRQSNQKALQIPRSALVESINNPYVYVIEGKVARQRKIEVGRELGNAIEVRSGLSAGEQVVTTGQLNLSDGKPVAITN